MMRAMYTACLMSILLTRARAPSASEQGAIASRVAARFLLLYIYICSYIWVYTKTLCGERRDNESISCTYMKSERSANYKISTLALYIFYILLPRAPYGRVIFCILIISKHHTHTHTQCLRCVVSTSHLRGESI